MNDDEVAIASSTPSYRFDAPATAAPAAALREPSARAVRFVDETLADQDAPVVIFALEWCEFCGSARRLLASMGVAYRSVDLDSAAYQAGDWGGDVRAALRARVGAPTIPQIFVGGAHVGGCTEMFDAFNDGSLQRLLRESGVAVAPSTVEDAYALLPKWLHPR